MDVILDPRKCSCIINHDDHPLLAIVNQMELPWIALPIFMSFIWWRTRPSVQFNFILHGKTQCQSKMVHGTSHQHYYNARNFKSYATTHLGTNYGHKLPHLDFQIVFGRTIMFWPLMPTQPTYFCKCCITN